ncbi:MAG: TonB-dependent receptor [Bacteroidetes bacterium]|nr:TonB-dependent receptor [Bacteroidota bacterium]
MFLVKHFAALTGLCVCVLLAQAQSDSVIHELPQATVLVRGEAELHSQLNLSTDNSRISFTETLGQAPGMQIRDNGAGSLSTLAIRGGSPEQSTVYWNGISLQNNTNGVTDMNLFPVQIFDYADFNNINSAGRGSGSIAGSLDLKNKSFLNDSLSKISIGLGSFGTKQFFGVLNYRVGNSYHQTRILQYNAKNNYTYPSPNYKATEPETLKHASRSLFSVMHQMDLRTKKSGSLHLRIWAQNSEREIPPTILEASSIKSQTDNFLRFQGDWSTRLIGGTLKINAAEFIENLIYREYDTFNYFSNTSTLLLHYTRSVMRRSRSGIDIETRNYNADADTFYKRNRSELALALHHQYYGFVRVNMGLRWATYSSFNSSPILYSLIISKNIGHFTNQFALNSNYRVPTFNNLYWRPGGNPDLIPEKSHRQELSSAYHKRKWEVDFRAFSIFIQNQIQWLPGSSGYFEAVQITDKTRWNRGLECDVHYVLKKFDQRINANFTRSGNLDSNFKTDVSQQLYVPYFQMAYVAKYKAKNGFCGATVQYQSKRFTNVLNTNYLEFFVLIGFQAHREIKNFSIDVSVNNILNHYYSFQPNRPMPGRNFLINLSYRFKTMKPQKTSSLIEIKKQ